MTKAPKNFRYTVIFEEAPEGGYLVRVPTLGCTTQGETFEEAKAMAEDVIRAYCTSLIKHGEPVPQEGPIGVVSSLSVTLKAA